MSDWMRYLIVASIGGGLGLLWFQFGMWKTHPDAYWVITVTGAFLWGFFGANLLPKKKR